MNRRSILIDKDLKGKSAMELTKISKKMSYMLRHSTDPLYIDLNGGWADVNTIIKALKERYPEVTRSVVEQIVAQDEKEDTPSTIRELRSAPIRDIRSQA